MNDFKTHMTLFIKKKNFIFKLLFTEEILGFSTLPCVFFFINTIVNKLGSA
jgi:hypothetical protein